MRDRGPRMMQQLAAQAPPGLVWLSGYPRSGAALVRTILAHCFGHVTSSLYGECDLGEGYADALKHRPLPVAVDGWAGVVAEQGMVTVKTHEWPQDETVPAIVIVRDGRRVCGSLRDFYRNVNRAQIPMTDIIRGAHPWGCWSHWVARWGHRAAPALWLRYEDLMADPMPAIGQIERMFCVERVGVDRPDFQVLHTANPTIFRKACMSGNGNMTHEEEGLFWQLHGSTMARLGYRRDGSLAPFCASCGGIWHE